MLGFESEAVRAWGRPREAVDKHPPGFQSPLAELGVQTSGLPHPGAGGRCFSSRVAGVQTETQKREGPVCDKEERVGCREVRSNFMSSH